MRSVSTPRPSSAILNPPSRDSAHNFCFMLLRNVHRSRGDHCPALRPDGVRLQPDHESVRNRLREPRAGEPRGGDGRRESQAAGAPGVRVAYRDTPQGHDGVGHEMICRFTGRPIDFLDPVLLGGVPRRAFRSTKDGTSCSTRNA